MGLPQGCETESHTLQPSSPHEPTPPLQQLWSISNVCIVGALPHKLPFCCQTEAIIHTVICHTAQSTRIHDLIDLLGLITGHNYKHSGTENKIQIVLLVITSAPWTAHFFTAEQIITCSAASQTFSMKHNISANERSAGSFGSLWL